MIDAGDGTVIGDNGNDILLGGAGTDQLDGGEQYPGGDRDDSRGTNGYGKHYSHDW